KVEVNTLKGREEITIAKLTQTDACLEKIEKVVILLLNQKV
ncbi:1047_t:CDS:1, partial [Funneliformis geosporum]